MNPPDFPDGFIFYAIGILIVSGFFQHLCEAILIGQQLVYGAPMQCGKPQKK